ncbi:hypothetical protein [Leucobacter sp. M11]|uniref:hypothetical protein n=1 Tax=Leucobacter sp. M11 TaxID=2993565 RepID=UPI002D7EB77B|nr:hypothetical protein [Leucobacter sp. M11]MEB4613988.1 hypothetical protein [Leucobacter sp. M11]
MSNDTEFAVTRLTEPHSVIVEGHTVHWPALLEWVREQVTPGLSRKKNGGGEGCLINEQAMMVLELIDAEAQLMCEALFVDGKGTPAEKVTRAWEAARTERQGGRMDDDQWERICAGITRWVWLIEDLGDPETEREVTEPCPECGERYSFTVKGERRSAVYIHYKPGNAPIAECRTGECSALWVGWQQVARLGALVGSDVDWEALAAVAKPAE